MAANTQHMLNAPGSGRYIVLAGGIPLGGKGTLTKSLHAETGGIILSTGAWARHKCEIDEDFKRLYEPVIKRGDYLPDKLIHGFCQENVREVNQVEGVIYKDGVIRTFGLGELLRTFVARPNLLVYFDVMVPEHVVFSRAKERFEQEHRLDDFDEETVRHRISVFHRHNEPLHRALRHHKIKIIPIDGTMSKEDVFLCAKKKLIRHLDDIDEMAVTQHTHRPHGHDRRFSGTRNGSGKLPGWRRPHSVLEAHPHSGPRATRD